MLSKDRNLTPAFAAVPYISLDHQSTPIKDTGVELTTTNVEQPVYKAAGPSSLAT
jgi:hypothetical protein